jgi:hypothetical protein
VIDLGRSCSRYRPLLVDFVDRGEVSAGTPAALAHLDRCGRCTEAIESTMLTVTALRRLGDEVAAVEPPADAWPRLRIRITSWPRRPMVMSPLAGVAMSFAIVAVLVLPFRVGGTSLLGPAATSTAVVYVAPNAADRHREDAYIAVSHRPTANAAADADAPTGNYRRMYPDNYRPTRKEVSSAEPTGRPPEAI